MTTPEDYIGFRNRARDDEERVRKIREQLERKDTSWADLARAFQEAHQQEMENIKTANAMVMDENMPVSSKRIAFDAALAFDIVGWAQINASLTTRLGRELNRTHQRLADVEKELRALRAALK